MDANSWGEEVMKFIEGRKCRREELDREIDGFMGRVRCEVGEEEYCDVCSERALSIKI
jgi:hypothetical protein